MQVILQEDIQSLGKAGDVVKVKDGYGRNYLIPQKKAVLADLKNLKMLEHQKRVVTAKITKIKRQADELAKRIAAAAITIARNAGEEGKLFGSVTAKDIVDALRKEGFNIDKRQVTLPEPIHQLGTFDVEVKLHSEVNCTVKIWVVKNS